MFKKLIRKKRHKRYVRTYIIQLRYDILNETLEATRISFTAAAINRLANKSRLLRKYERRIKLLDY